MIRDILVLASMALLLGVSSCSKDDESNDMMQTKNIVDVASADPNFSILVAALDKAGLAGILQGDGRYALHPWSEASAHAHGTHRSRSTQLSDKLQPQRRVCT